MIEIIEIIIEKEINEINKMSIKIKIINEIIERTFTKKFSDVYF